MDPKTLSSLDPKLRETYERVMGASGPASPLPGNTNAPTPAASPPPADLFAVSSAPPVPIPPPSPTATAGTLPANDTTAMPTADQPNQAADLATLQPSLTGTPTPASPEPTVELSQPPQPLPSPASINQAAKTPASPLIRTLYFIAGIIFFVVYAFFWLKIFNYPLPF